MFRFGFLDASTIRAGLLACGIAAVFFPSPTRSQTPAVPSATQPPVGSTAPGAPGRTGATLASSSGASAVNPATQQPAAPTVVDLTAMLRMIDPYRPDAQIAGTIKVYGSTAMDAMAHMWADQFKQFHPTITVEIAAAGSGDAFDQLRKNPTAVAMLSRPVTREELDKLKSDTIKNPVAFVVAREALGVYVHQTNPAQAISGEQLRAIFTTQSSEQEVKWKLLGVTGPMADQPIRLVARSETSGTQQFLRDFVFGGLQMRTTEGAHASNADALGALAKDPGAITICGLRAGGTSVKVLPLMAGGLIINSDDTAVMSGQYPLTRNMTVVVDLGQTGPAAEAAHELVHFAICQLGQLDAIRAGFYPADLQILRAQLDQLHRDHLR